MAIARAAVGASPEEGERDGRVFVSGAKDPARVESGRMGARRRWGPPRLVRLDELTADQRRLVLALVEAARSPAPAEPDGL